jgi:hypothetical protein
MILSTNQSVLETCHITLVTYGDMLRVPGSKMDLLCGDCRWARSSGDEGLYAISSSARRRWFKSRTGNDCSAYRRSLLPASYFAGCWGSVSTNVTGPVIPDGNGFRFCMSCGVKSTP